MTSRRPRAILFGADCPNNFSNDESDPLNSSLDGCLCAFFRTQLHKRNPDLFFCFLGGVPSFTPRQTSLDQLENPESFWDYTRKLGVGISVDVVLFLLI